MVCKIISPFGSITVPLPETTESDDLNMARNASAGARRLEKMMASDAGTLSDSIAVEHKNASRPTGNDSAAVDWEYLKICRDARHGGAWDGVNAVDCIEEIPIQVEIVDIEEGFPVLGVASVEKDVVIEGGLILFREGDVIILTAAEIQQIEENFFQSVKNRWEE